MPRRKKGISVYAPRRHGRRWRIEIRDGVTGARCRPSFDNEADAQQAYADAQQEAEVQQEPTIGELISRYEDYLLKSKGNRKSSTATTGARLRSFLKPQNLPLSKFSEEKLRTLYRARTKKAVDTHRNELSEVKTFFRWLSKMGIGAASPAEQIEPTGRRRKGKPQHRPGEAKAFLDYALAESLAGSDGAFAAAAALLLGLRQNAITRRVVRDVDELTRQLFIANDKSSAGERSVQIPEVLWPHFEQRIRNRSADEALLPSPRSRDGFRDKSWLRKHTLRICHAVKLPLISAHGLRGTHSTLAAEAGATGALVAKQLGHSSEKVARDSYLAPGTTARMQSQRAQSVLSGATPCKND